MLDSINAEAIDVGLTNAIAVSFYQGVDDRRSDGIVVVSVVF